MWFGDALTSESLHEKPGFFHDRILLCNRKDLVTLMRESSFLLHKRFTVDAAAGGCARRAKWDCTPQE